MQNNFEIETVFVKKLLTRKRFRKELQTFEKFFYHYISLDF